MNRDEFKESLSKIYYVQYKDKIIKFKPVYICESEDNYVLDGYSHECPTCGRRVYLNANRHKVDVTDDKLTVSPSMVCPHKCGCHVWLKDGIMSDC